MTLRIDTLAYLKIKNELLNVEEALSNFSREIEQLDNCVINNSLASLKNEWKDLKEYVEADLRGNSL